MTPQLKEQAARSEPAKASGYAWYVLIALTACYTLSFIDRQILGVMVGPIKKELNISDTAVGFLQGLAFAVFYTLLGLPMGRLADRGNRRNLCAGGVAVWSMFTALCASARSFWTLFFSRMGVGVGEASLGPAAYSLISDYFPQHQLGLALSVYYFGNILGSSLASFLGGTIAQMVSTQPEMTVPIIGTIASWRVVFLLLGGPGLLFALLVFTVKEPVRKGVQTAGGLSLGQAWVEIRKRLKTVLGLSIAFVFQATCNYGFNAWINPFFTRVHGWNVGQSGRAVGTLLLVFGCAGLYFGGWLCDRWYKRGITDAALRVAVPCAIGMAILFPIAMLMPTPELSLLFIAPGLFFMSLPMGTAAAALQFIFPNEVRGTVSALYLFILNLGALTIGPLVPALFNDYVFRDPLKVGYSIALTIGTASVLMLFTILATMKSFREDYRAMHPHSV